jgi:predicted transcriptional regulator
MATDRERKDGRSLITDPSRPDNAVLTSRSPVDNPRSWATSFTPGTIRLSLDVSPELNEALEQLASRLHTTKSDVLRKAIALMEVAVRAKDEHKKFGIAAPNQPLETEIVGL